ncbi:uncharacterized protein [Phaseolus vulgaris]|uniref:uncharacterized protein n=1 Tax=Phaseolus vulgaris TaxID=3885 RepID=UPI0035CBCCB9
MEKYLRTSDLKAHVKACMIQTQLFSKDMDVHYMLIPTTLEGVSLEWYYSLPRNLVDIFDTFYGRFLARFADCKPMAATSTSLHNVVQEEAEGLRQFMVRFARATLNIPDLHPTMSVHALLVGLRPGKKKNI